LEGCRRQDLREAKGPRVTGPWKAGMKDEMDVFGMKFSVIQYDFAPYIIEGR